MPRLLCWFAVLLASVVGTAARADGLLYQLPEDGAWVRFDLESSSDGNAPRQESVFLRSVGRAFEGDGSRWLELKVPQEEGTQIIKLLIPERRLKEGEAPLEHVIRGWVKRRATPDVLMNPRGLWQLMLLPGPLDEVKELESKVVDGPLGELKCQGLTGRAQVTEDDGHQEELTYTIRRHPKSPFGVVTCTIDGIVKFGGKTKARFKLELKLAEVGKDAKSELPGYE
jgi:hypothetical protein